MYPFSKLLKLPSNGLSYKPFIKLKPLTNAFMYAAEDATFQTNFTETKATLLEPYMDISPYEMYYSDLIFIWNYYMVTTFKKTEIIKPEFCRVCNTENEVLIPLDNLDIVYLDKAEEILKFECEYNEKPMKVFYRRRKVLDNILSAFDNLELQDALNNIKNYISYFSNLLHHQIVEINYDNKNITEISKEIIYDIFNYSNAKDEFINLFYKNLLEEVDFGILNNIWYVCKHCSEKNKVKFTDVLIDSFILKNINTDFKKNIAYVDFIREGFIRFEELLNMPIQLNEPFFENCIEVLEKNKDGVSGNAIDYRKFHGLA